jgi:cell division protein FtsA
MAKENKDFVVGLDIGTFRMKVVVAEINAQAQLRVVGVGTHDSRGLKRGAVVDINAAVHSIQQALQEAAGMAECSIHRVYAGITGNHIRGITSPGMVKIRGHEVTQADVQKVIEAAQAINMASEQRLLLVEAQEFELDSQAVSEPVGMSGLRLDARVHIVTAAAGAADNIIKCVRRCGLELEDLLINAHASSAAVLTEDEKDLGVVVVDIGAGTTDVAIYSGGAIRHTAVIPIAGDLITSDIAMALHTPTKDAEEMKIVHGCAKQLLASPDEKVEVAGLGDRAPRFVSKQVLSGVIEPRVEEVFTLVLQVVRNSGLEEVLSSGFVITGGAAAMPGMVELAEDIFLKPVRIGLPIYKGHLQDFVVKPQMATAMGFLETVRQGRARGARVGRQSSGVGAWWARVRDFLIGNF